ncbi:uncharacterized protein LOC144162730 [Haemaphysalis longicornis]
MGSSVDGHSHQPRPQKSRRQLHCHQCSYVTSLPAYLKRHHRTPTGECRFHCHLCPAAFVQEANLVTHVRFHTGERPFRCRFCPEAFASRTAQKIHEKEDSHHP